MRKIDAHAHILDQPHYVDQMVKAMDQCGIEKACVSGLGPLFGHVTNQQIAELLQSYSDRFIGAVFLRPGVDSAESIHQAYADGFRLVKITIPRVPYDDPSLFPLWNEAQELRMPVLFHTGVVTTAVEAPGERINSWFMHPLRIEAITREFPNLTVIIAHLGVHWNDDAAELARMRPNVYVDLTGEPDGWRARADAVGMNKWLWWPKCWNKVVFGTDTHYTKFNQIIQQDVARFDHLHIDDKTRERFFSRTISQILRLK